MGPSGFGYCLTSILLIVHIGQQVSDSNIWRFGAIRMRQFHAVAPFSSSLAAQNRFLQISSERRPLA